MFRTVLLLALAIAPMAAAHDLWIEREGDAHRLMYGHERSGHAGERELEYRPEIVRQARCFDVAGNERPARASDSYPVVLRGDCAASWFWLDSGYWSKTPYGTKNLPRHQAGTTLDSWRSAEGIKRLDRWSTALARPLTTELELTPLRDPLALRPGDKLRLRVWLRGRPAAGVTVAYFGSPRGVTDADGYVNVTLRQPGFQLIQASVERPIDDLGAEREILASSLQFQLP